MPFTLRPHRRFPVQCAATYNATPFQHAAAGLLFCFQSLVVGLKGHLRDRVLVS
jgi:hypothetical protein